MLTRIRKVFLVLSRNCFGGFKAAFQAADLVTSNDESDSRHRGAGRFNITPNGL